MHLVPIPFLIITVTLLIRAEFHRDKRQIYLWKPLSTLLVIAVALLSLLTPGAVVAFTCWITVGLVLSLGGDIALMFDSKRAFLIGLVLFLLAHVVYAIGLTIFNGFHSQDLIVGALLLAVGLALYAYLKPGLDGMQGPVLLYVLVILFMVNRAISTFWGTTFTVTQTWLLSLGAVLFMLSDVVLAINRFRHPFAANRFGLYLYYGGQLFIALSLSYFG